MSIPAAFPFPGDAPALPSPPRAWYCAAYARPGDDIAFAPNPDVGGGAGYDHDRYASAGGVGGTDADAEAPSAPSPSAFQFHRAGS